MEGQEIGRLTASMTWVVFRPSQGEQVRFDNGESSVFLLNAREAGLVTARVKLAELQAKYAQTQATLRWAAGGVE